MATSFLQMAYNLTDIIWIGRIGSRAVAAIGTAGFYMWFGMAFVLLSKVGGQVKVSQSIGREDYGEARNNARSALQLILILGLIYGLALFSLNKYLIDFFGMEDAGVVQMARDYLKIIGLGIMFYFINPIFTAIYNGYGDSKTPFKINAVGLVMNMILDPLLILVFNLGVQGAALATIASQFVVAAIFVYKFFVDKEMFEDFQLLKKFELRRYWEFIKLGFPISLKSGLFTFIAMVIARLIADYGAIPIAVQKIGSQLEALSWMTADGFAMATATFAGQNFGAENFERVKKGYFEAVKIMAAIGLVVTALFLLFPRQIFSIFVNEQATINEGVTYLRILAISQIFMTIEITTEGAFNGLSKTIYPSAISITFNALRIPGAILLSSTALGLSGIWWSISLSSVLKGIVAITLFMYLIYKTPILKHDDKQSIKTEQQNIT
jgi:putative MATE family efflux protein